MNRLYCDRIIQVVDARPKGRYDGTAPEPNPKIRSGHMLGSICFPFTNVIDPQTKTMKDADALKQGVYTWEKGHPFEYNYILSSNSKIWK